ncbi:MAG: hypothetical protein WAV16_00445 [Candidatus Moraniibacteriota bacterium]
MKRGAATQGKLNMQRLNFVRELHYSRVEEVGNEKKRFEIRKRRLDIIVERGIGQNGKKEIQLPNGAVVSFRFIREDGIIILDNWDEIDVLRIFPAK